RRPAGADAGRADLAGAAQARGARRAGLRRRDARCDGVRAAPPAPRARAVGRGAARAGPARGTRALRRPALGRKRRARALRRGGAPREEVRAGRYPCPSSIHSRVPTPEVPMALKNVVLVDGARSAFARGAKGKLVATRLDEAGATVLR